MNNRIMNIVQEVVNLTKKWTPSSDMAESDDDKPAEIYDKHPISAMTSTIDNEQYSIDDLLQVSDSWRTEWHKDGVQVPVNSLRELPKPILHEITAKKSGRRNAFHLPKKLIRITEDDRVNPEVHQLVPLQSFTESLVRYHVDEMDYAWMEVVNEERECLGQKPVEDWMVEKVFDTLERLCHEKMQKNIREAEGIGIEFDENTKCDICLSTEGEDENELVFCDECFLCVHQACYGIPNLPAGSWLCRMCERRVKPNTPCALCPNTGGAMKMVEDSQQWCHVSCAVWVPEVGFGDLDLMEPVVHMEEIPQARWTLVCSLCKVRSGACIQCTVKQCKTAFHVTCAMRRGLVMRQILHDSDEEVKLQGYCIKHCRKELGGSPVKSPMKMQGTTPRTPTKKEADLNGVTESQSAEDIRKQKLAELAENFHSFVTTSDLSTALKPLGLNTRLPVDIRDTIYIYWKLKRRSNHNRPFVTSWEEPGAAAQERDTRLANRAILNAFCKVRFGLDRARLVIDMVLKREKKKLSLLSRMAAIVDRQFRCVTTNKALNNLSEADLSFLSSVHIGENVYDNAALFELYAGTKSANASTSGSGVASTTGIEVKLPKKRSRLDLVSEADAVSESPPSKKLALDRKPRSKMQGPKCARRRTMGSILNDLHPVDLIPRDQLIVPETIKSRLRSGLARPEYSHLIRGIGEAVTSHSPCSGVNGDPLDSSDEVTVESASETLSATTTRQQHQKHGQSPSATSSFLPQKFSNVFDVVAGFLK